MAHALSDSSSNINETQRVYCHAEDEWKKIQKAQFC